MKKRKFGFATIVGLMLGPVASAAVASLPPQPPVTFNKDKLPLSQHACLGNPTGSVVRVRVVGLKERRGILRVQLYNAVKGEFFEKGHWLVRMQGDVPANGEVAVCMPLQSVGRSYGILVRHDANGNGKTDSSDGAGVSNNPKLSLFSKPKASEAAFMARSGLYEITIVMNYLSGLSLKPGPDID